MSAEKINIPSKNILRQNYEVYNPYFTDIMQFVVDTLKTKVKLSSQPTYKSRVKSFESYYKKVLRLKSDQLEETNRMIYLTDMMGIRMICAFMEDINFAVDQIKNLFFIK